MSNCIIIYGRSGTGKTSSLDGFGPEGVGLINVLGKPLPFRGELPSVCTTNIEHVKAVIRDSKARSIVVDDAGYLITDMFMKRHASASKGNGVFALYNELGDSMYSLMRFIAELPDPDKVVYLIFHEDVDEAGNSKIKTIGKLLDEKVCLEGMVSVLLHAMSADGTYFFVTNGEGISKSPRGMFNEACIPNELSFVDKTIREYWGLAPLTDVSRDSSDVDCSLQNCSDKS